MITIGILIAVLFKQAGGDVLPGPRQVARHVLRAAQVERQDPVAAVESIVQAYWPAAPGCPEPGTVVELAQRTSRQRRWIPAIIRAVVTGFQTGVTGLERA